MNVPSLRSLRTILLFLLLLAIPGLLLRSTVYDPPGKQNSFDRSIRRIGAPLEAGMAYSANWIASFFQRWVFQANLLDENRDLALENRQLRLQMNRLRELEEQNRILRRTLQLRDRHPEDMLAAEVVGGEQSPFFRRVKLTIDRGAPFVRPGMAVLDADGVIGRISRSFEEHSEVMLITDPASKIAVEVVRLPGCHGILEGTGEDSCVVSLTCESKVKVGDTIQTSGVDDLFPKAHYAGRVVAVEQKAGSQELDVVPLVRLDTLGTVWVVLASAPPPDPDAGRPKPREAAFGLQTVR